MSVPKNPLRSTSISRVRPLYIAVLVDGSGSMGLDGGKDEQGRTKAQIVTQAIRDFINEAYLLGISGSSRYYKNYIFLSVVSYNTSPEGKTQVKSIFNFNSGTSEHIKSASVLSISDVVMNTDELSPVVVHARGGTPMSDAFYYATNTLIPNFCENFEDLVKSANPGLNLNGQFLPSEIIVLNITDGRFDNTCSSNAKTMNRNHVNSPEDAIKQLLNLSYLSSATHLTVMNVFVSLEDCPSIIFPSSCEIDDDYYKFLFAYSSQLTPEMVSAAQSQKLNVKDGARAVAYNLKKPADLFRVFTVGTLSTLPSLSNKFVEEVV